MPDAAPTPAAPADPAEPAPWGSSGRPGPTWSGQPPVTPANVPASTATRALTTAEGTPVLAGVGRRIGAFAIDLTFSALGFFAIAVIVFIVYIGATDLTIDDEMTDAQAETIGLWIWLVGGFVLFAVTWIANATGGSAGKRILGLRIVRDDLQPPGIGLGLGRTLGAWLSWLAVGLGFLWGTWDDRGQTWHDKMAGTFVVRVERYPYFNQSISRGPGSGAGPGSLH